MKSASIALPEEPPNSVTGGLDWARDDHAVSVVDTSGYVPRHAGQPMDALGDRRAGASNPRAARQRCVSLTVSH